MLAKLLGSDVGKKSGVWRNVEMFETQILDASTASSAKELFYIIYEVIHVVANSKRFL